MNHIHKYVSACIKSDPVPDQNTRLSIEYMQLYILYHCYMMCIIVSDKDAGYDTICNKGIYN